MSMERKSEDNQSIPYERLARIIFQNAYVDPGDTLRVQAALERLGGIEINKLSVEIVRIRWEGPKFKKVKDLANEMGLQPLMITVHETRIISALKHEILQK